MNKTRTENCFDLIIVGGGLVGASLACALRASGLSIAVIEPYEISHIKQPCYDDRTVALSSGSRQIFDTMGVWSTICAQDETIKPEPIRPESIRHIHISDRGHFGVTRLSSEEEGVDALGYVVENRVIGEVLYQQINAADTIQLYCPARLTSFSQSATEVRVGIETEKGTQTLHAALLVAADGQQSQMKQSLHIGDVRQNYKQSALVTNITPGRPHNNVAYERFTETGPLAFLPMAQNRCSVVWSLPHDKAQLMLTLGEADFLQQLQQAFGYRLGVFEKTGRRQVYPLILQQATRLVEGRVVIVGNAAHTIHPVAGQGFNLALRDISLLAEMLVDANRGGEDVGSSTLLAAYVDRRHDDMMRVYRFTDTLVKIFSTPFPPLAHCRSLGLFAVDLLPAVKHQLARQSMGLSGRLSRLNRGNAL